MSTKADNHDHEKTKREAFGHRSAERSSWEGGAFDPQKGGSATNEAVRNDCAIFRPASAHPPTPPSVGEQHGLARTHTEWVK